jgi:TolA-binding protein
MTEEKREDLKQQQDFLSGHEQLLNAINKPKAAAPIEEPSVEEIPVDEVEVEEAAVAEPAIEEAVVAEPEPVAAPAPAKVAAQPKPKPKKPAQPKPERRAEKPHHHIDHKALEQAEVKEVLKVFQKYMKPTATVILVVCALFLANNFFRGNRLKKEASADAALMNAKSAADYQAILDDFSSTPSDPLAMMGLAQQNFNEGKLDEAMKLYSGFVKKYPGHEMAEQAEFNLITCKEAKGELGEASILYGDFKDKHGDSHLAPVALLGKARCFETLDNHSEAKQVYEDVITYYPESGWSQIAETQLKVVERILK